MNDDNPTELDAQAPHEPRAPSTDERTSSPTSIVGHVVDGRYEIRSLLGAGGMGYVYLAFHHRMEREVVLKTLRPELTSNERTRARFVREAQSSTRVQHPHVIKVHDYGIDEEYGAYYVMEHLVGRDLGQEMHHVGRPLQIERALHIARQVASALASAHGAAVVHRDLKPENVFLIAQNGEPDFVKVLDFGLARLMDANRRLTETGQVIGTPRYMAPEQCRGEKVDARADVYSLALILYQMVTGEQPYKDFSTYEILGKKMFEEITPPSALNPPRTLPPSVETLLVRCLDRDPAKRPPDGEHLAEALRQVVDELGLDPGPFAPRSSRPNLDPWPKELPMSPSIIPPQKKSRRGLFLGLLVTFLVIAGGVPAIYFAIMLQTGHEISFGGARDVAPITTGQAIDEAAVEVATAPDPVVAEPAEPVVDPTWVTVASTPPGAEVWAADRLLGTTPLRLTRDDGLADGTRVEVRMEGFVTRELSLFADVPEPSVRLHPEDPDDE